VTLHAPEAKQAQALDKIAALKSTASLEHPDLATLESVQRWFEAELPSPSGAVLSAIFAFEPRAKETRDELVLDFRQRFSELS
jgi:hypothetical protein